MVAHNDCHAGLQRVNTPSAKEDEFVMHSVPCASTANERNSKAEGIGEAQIYQESAPKCMLQQTSVPWDINTTNGEDTSKKAADKVPLSHPSHTWTKNRVVIRNALLLRVGACST